MIVDSAGDPLREAVAAGAVTQFRDIQMAGGSTLRGLILRKGGGDKGIGKALVAVRDMMRPGRDQ